MLNTWQTLLNTFRFRRLFYEGALGPVSPNGAVATRFLPVGAVSPDDLRAAHGVGFADVLDFHAQRIVKDLRRTHDIPDLLSVQVANYRTDPRILDRSL